jgi:hypothetical protein
LDHAAAMGLPGKRCRCGDVWPLAFFEKNGKCRGGKVLSPEEDCDHPACYRSVCIGCRLDGRVEGDDFLKKVTGTYRVHAVEDGITLEQLLYKLGTTLEEEADDIRYLYETGVCPKKRGPAGPGGYGCGRRFTSMPHGPADMTLDRIREHLPLTRGNMQWLCRTCNRAKHQMSAERFEIRQRCWELREQFPPRPRPEQLRFIEADCIRRRPRPYKPRSRREDPPPPPPPQSGFF